MVYYKSLGSLDKKFPSTNRAAVITDVREVHGVTVAPLTYQVRLSVFNPTGLFFTDWLDQGQKGGQWDWMPFQKDQAARMAPGTMNESHPATAPGSVTAAPTAPADIQLDEEEPA